MNLHKAKNFGTKFLPLLFVALSSLRAQAQDMVEASSTRDHQHALGLESRGLSFSEAMRLASMSRSAQAAELAANVLQEAEEHISGLPSDLTISTEFGPQILPTLEFQGRIGVAQAFALSDLGGARRHSLRTESEVRRLDVQSLNHERRMVVGEMWLRSWSASRDLDLCEEQKRLADELKRLAERGFALGELTRMDQTDALAFWAEAQRNERTAEGLQREAEIAFTHELRSELPLRTLGEPAEFAVPSEEEIAILLSHPELLPSLQILEAAMRVDGARVNELRASYASQISIGAIADRTTPEGFAAIGTLNLTLPTSDRARGEQARYEANALEREGLQDVEARRLQALVRQLHHDFHHAQDLRNVLEGLWIPSLESSLNAKTTLFGVGEVSAFEVIAAQRTLLEARRNLQQLRYLELSAAAALQEMKAASEVAESPRRSARVQR